MIGSMALNIAESELEDYQRELLECLDAFDERWQARSAERDPQVATLLAGGVFSVGGLGPGISEHDLADMQKAGPGEAPVDPRKR